MVELSEDYQLLPLQLNSDESLHERFAIKAEFIADRISLPDYSSGDLVAALLDPRAFDSYVSARPAVLRFVVEELDFADSSIARLGLRPSKAYPRLGGYFQDSLASPHVRAVLAVGIEDIIFASFAARAANPKRPDDRWENFPRSMERTWEILVEMIDEFPVATMPLVYEVAAPEAEDMKRQADTFGITRGIFSFRKKAVVNANTHYYMHVGQMLWEAST